MHTSRCLVAHASVPTVLAGGQPVGGHLYALEPTLTVVEARERFGVVVACAAPFMLLAFRRPPTANDLSIAWWDPALDANEQRPDIIPFGPTGPVRVLFPEHRWCVVVGDLHDEGGSWRRPFMWTDELATLDPMQDHT